MELFQTLLCTYINDVSLRYDVAKKSVSVLFEGLSFGNGVALSPKEDFVLAADIGRFRIWKHDLKSATTEVFADFQGAPDNLKSTPRVTTNHLAKNLLEY